MLKIKLDDACTLFSLYDSQDRYVASSRRVGDLLQHVASCYDIEVSFCQSESHMLAVIQETVDIEVCE